MTIFLLSFYICTTLNFPDGLLATKTCRWQSDGTMWASREVCDQHGKDHIGKPHFSDVADGAVYENYSCLPQAVLK